MTPRLRWKSEWTLILALALMLRMMYAVLGWSVAAGPAPEPLAAGSVYEFTARLLAASPLAEKLVNVWWRWDTPYYLSIAAQGYAIERTQAYLPLYPVLIAGARSLAGGDYLLSALLIAGLAAVAAGLLLYETAADLGWSAPDALRSVISMFLFPTAFFLFAAYTEALFLALVLSTWLLARRRKWYLAGGLGALAALTRHAGALMAGVLLWMYLVESADARDLPLTRQMRQVWQRGLAAFKSPAWLAALLPAAALGLYLAWARFNGHTASTALLAGYWGIDTVPPWEGVRLFLQRLLFTERVFIDWIDLSLFVIVLAGCVHGLFRMEGGLSLYCWLNLGLLMMRGTPPHLLDSYSRYLLMIFPVFLLFGRMRNRLAYVFILVLSFMVQIVLAWGFLQWKWVA